MNQKDYKNIAGIIKELFDELENILKQIGKAFFGNERVPNWFYILKKVSINRFADYFERENKGHKKGYINYFNRQQFLKMCGVEK